MLLPLRLQLKVSRSYLVFLASGHILAGVAVCLLPLPLIVRSIALVLLAVLLLRCWRIRAEYLPDLLLRGDGKFDIGVGSDEPVTAVVNEDTLVWPWLVVLHGQSEVGRLKVLLLFPDSLVGSDSHRQLRLWLRWRSDLNLPD